MNFLIKKLVFLSMMVLFAANSMAADEAGFPIIFEATRRAVLSAEIAGVLKDLKYDVGDHVKKGAVIAEVDTGELQLRIKRNNMGLKYLDVQVEDLTKLSQRGLGTNESVAKANMERDVTRTDNEILNRQISHARIIAPFDCAVLKRQAQPHEWVTAGQPVLEVIDSERLKAVANIPTHLAVGLQKGAVHSVYVHDLKVSVDAKVTAIAPQVDERSNTAQVIWTVEKSSKDLFAGMKGEVKIGGK
ncbi:MAG: hypothetical protein BWK80_58365 [Desulfobacteraceae bacterium IS3]|nr:MAG: hypothetical protein BWK80_58365 [Desulfobacteraceae bacterium IS3]HAO22663.1 hypothetical protein [Desulfobacteraceae bacterium]